MKQTLVDVLKYLTIFGTYSYDRSWFGGDGGFLSSRAQQVFYDFESVADYAVHPDLHELLGVTNKPVALSLPVLVPADLRDEPAIRRYKKDGLFGIEICCSMARWVKVSPLQMSAVDIQGVQVDTRMFRVQVALEGKGKSEVLEILEALGL